LLHVQVEHLSLCLLKDVKKGRAIRGAKKAGGRKGRHATRLQLVQLLGACSHSLVSLTLSGGFFLDDFFGNGHQDLGQLTSRQGLLGVPIPHICYT
jgi:hypothetical protein